MIYDLSDNYKFIEFKGNPKDITSTFKKNLADFEVLGIAHYVDEWFEYFDGLRIVTENIAHLVYSTSYKYAKVYNTENFDFEMYNFKITHENGEIDFKGLKLNHFALTEQDELVMVLEEGISYRYFFIK